METKLGRLTQKLKKKSNAYFWLPEKFPDDIFFIFWGFLGYAKLYIKLVYKHISKSHSTQSDPLDLPSLHEAIKK